MNILLVDDDPAIRLMAGTVLERFGGHRVREAEDAAGAVAAFAAERPDVVLLDYMLPDADGEQAFDRLVGAAGGDPPAVVFLTGKNDPETVERLKARGARGVIAKPFDPTRLPETLLAILEA